MAINESKKEKLFQKKLNYLEVPYNIDICEMKGDVYHCDRNTPINVRKQRIKIQKQSNKETKKESLFVRILCFLQCVFLWIFGGVVGNVFFLLGGRSVPNKSYLGTLFQTCCSKGGKLKTAVSCTPNITF